MKTFSCILLSCLATALAQTAPTPPTVVPAQPRRVVDATPTIDPTSEAAPTRIDLDFKGGTPAALIDALSQAVGKRVNAIIDDSDAKVQLPAIRVRNADLASVFAAMATATAKQVAVPTSSQMGGTISYQYQNVQSQFLPPPTAAFVTDDTVWSFVSNELDSQKFLESTKSTQRALRHFQLGPYLTEKLTVEDITTAIRTGWEMLDTKEKPELKFHKETGILIAAGDEKLLEQIPQVLQQLPRTPGSPEYPSTNLSRSRRILSNDPSQSSSEGARR